MSTKSFKELKNLSKDEIAVRIRESESKLFAARIQGKLGQLKDTASLWKIRKTLARLKTLQTAGK